MTMETIIREALKNADLSWFTEMIKGTQHRFAIGLTNNSERTVELLAQQARFFFDSFDNLTIWGRTDPKTWIVYVDIGTTTDDRLQAHMLKKLFNQQCIYDFVIEETVG